MLRPSPEVKSEIDANAGRRTLFGECDEEDRISFKEGKRFDRLAGIRVSIR